jgi:hypothetical protein
MIGAAVAAEIWPIIREKQPYDSERYKAALNKIG